MIVRGLVAIAVFMGASVCGQAHAGAVLSPMEQCAAQWHDLRVANAIGGQNYKTFTARCLKGQTVAAPAPRSGTPRSEAHGARATRPKRPNRMQVCAARWRAMKADNTTDGLTYRQWSSRCLSGG